MNMPKVTQCDAIQCAYNVDEICHALAITIGNGSRPKCDTYCPYSMKGGDPSSTAGVGACKVLACGHNQDLECQAPNITVAFEAQEADCMTFRAR